jgi:hypothetical protein
MALRSPPALALDGAAPLADGALEDVFAAVGLVLDPDEVFFLLEQPLTSSAAAMETTPANCTGRRRRCEVTRDLQIGPGEPGRFGAGVARPGQISIDAPHLAS